MFTLEIIMSLFGIAIPLEHTGIFFDKFFESDWDFFSNLIIAFLTEIQDNLLALDDPWDIIRVIKYYTNPLTSNSASKAFFDILRSSHKLKFKKLDWAKLIAETPC